MTANTVPGTVTAGNNGNSLTLTAPTVALASTGSLIANATEPAAGGAITPSLIALQADTISLLPGATIVAGDGVVALAPLSAGKTITIDGTTTANGNLSLTPSDLGKISTIGPLGKDKGPLGTQTLVLGSLDGVHDATSLGNSPAPTTAAVMINTNVDLTGIASTLSLFSTGTIATNGGTVAVTAHALTASAGGGISLPGTNQFNQLGVLGTTAVPSVIPGITAKNDVIIANSRDLNVVAPVISNSGSVGIMVHAGAGTFGDLTNNSVIQGQTGVALTADRDINNAGTADGLASNSLISAVNNDATLSAGRDINNNGTVKAVNGDADLTASDNINNNVLVTASNNASLGAGHDINNDGIAQAVTIDAILKAGHDIATSGTVEAGNNAILTSGTATTVVNGDAPSGIFQTDGIITAGGTDGTTAAVALTANNAASVLNAGTDHRAEQRCDHLRHSAPPHIKPSLCHFELQSPESTAAGTIFSGAAPYPSGTTAPLGTVVLSTTTGDITCRPGPRPAAVRPACWRPICSMRTRLREMSC